MSSVKQLAAWNSSSKARLSPGAFLSVNLTACSTWSPRPSAALQNTLGTSKGNLLRGLYGASFFFFLEFADVALRLGPYMSISCEKMFVQGHSWSTIAGRSKQTNKSTKTTKDDPQIPQPDLRFVRESGKPDQKPNQTQTKTGPEPEKQHPQDQSANGHSGLTTASLSKTCEMN